MRLHGFLVAAALFIAPALAAQQPDSAARAKARADSIALMRELGAATNRPAPSNAPAGPQTGPTNPRLLPDISAVGDLIGDFSPKGSTQEDGTRFGVREVELAVQAVVDPYFRGDFFLGISDLEGIAIEQAFLTTTSLPNQLEAKLGRFLMPFGKQNTTHRHDLHTIEYPYVIQKLFGPEGFKGTGVWGSRVVAPLGFFQEVQLTAIDRLGEPAEGLVSAEAANKSLGGLGFSARLRNYVDISEAQNIELSFSGLTGKREQPLSEAFIATLPYGGRVSAVNARQTTLAADLTYRWRPLQQGLYQSFILQGEVMHQRNERTPKLPNFSVRCGASCDDAYLGPTRDFTGAYVFARVQTSQRSFLGSRFDWVQDPESDGRTLRAGSVYLEWFPSEFSKLVAGYEGVSAPGNDAAEPARRPALLNRLLVQASFALGPHKPHPF